MKSLHAAVEIDAPAERVWQVVSDFGRYAEQLYAELEERMGHHVDRCVLYVFRSSVYFAERARPELELTRWWNWKDGGLAEERGLL